MAQSPATRPFSDLTAQESGVIQKIIAELKDPLLAIYDIGEKYECSHYKHLVRVCEYVLLSKKGHKLVFDFSDEKIQKARQNFAESHVPAEKKNEVMKLWEVAFSNLEELEGTEADKHEQFVCWFVIDLMTKFAGGRNFETFHAEKKGMFEMYNLMLDESVIPLKVMDKAARYAVLKEAGMPVFAE